MCIAKTGQVIFRNSKHMKATSITSKQYLRDQLSKDRKTEMLEDIIRQLENQT